MTEGIGCVSCCVPLKLRVATCSFSLSLIESRPNCGGMVYGLTGPLYVKMLDPI